MQFRQAHGCRGKPVLGLRGFARNWKQNHASHRIFQEKAVSAANFSESRRSSSRCPPKTVFNRCGKDRQPEAGTMSHRHPSILQ